MVRDNTFWETVEFSDVVEEESGYSFYCDHYVHWNEVYSFGDRIHDIYDSVMSGEVWEFDHKIDAECIPLFIWNREQLKLTNWRMSSEFHLETEISGTYILADILRHLGPPVVLGH